MSKLSGIIVASLLFCAAFVASMATAAEIKLTNVSYDPTRELYEEINHVFAEQYKSQTGDTVIIEQSHGGSNKQARAILDGVQADVATLSVGLDITALERGGLVRADWQKRLPDNSSPYTSTIIFLVRKGNPKEVKDWPDLIKPGVQVIVPNPKTGGGSRWAFLAAWGYAAGAKPTTGKSQEAELNATKGNEFVTQLYRNVPVLDTGARGSTITFTQKKIGDVLLTWENEAWLTLKEFGDNEYELVYPSISILAEPQVAVVDKVVDAKGTRPAAEAYLKFLYTPEAQEIIAANHYRPRSIAAAEEYSKELPPLPLFTLADISGNWDKTQKHFFADGGVFDQIYRKK